MVRGYLPERSSIHPAGPPRMFFIKVELAETSPSPNPGPPICISTDSGGYFMTQGLKPGQGYVLTAEARMDGKQLVGVVQARPPSANLTIRLRDDVELPAPSGQGVVTLPPPASSDLIPPAPVPLRPSADGGWAPGGVAPNRPVVEPRPANPFPLDPARPPRPENVADRPTSPWSPPASIPGSGVPTLPNPPVPPLPRDPADARKSSRTVRPGSNVSLVDSLGRPWDLATSRREPVVLMEFLTTTCIHCRKSTPILIDLQARYGAQGLQVLAVLCDSGSLGERTAKAARYQVESNLNYGVYVEPGADAGAVRDRFGIEQYPTAILLDATGKVVWKGHPGDAAGMDAAVRQQLSAR